MNIRYAYAPTGPDGEITGEWAPATGELAQHALGPVPYGGMLRRTARDGHREYHWGGGWRDTPAAAIAAGAIPDDEPDDGRRAGDRLLNAPGGEPGGGQHPYQQVLAFALAHLGTAGAAGVTLDQAVNVGRRAAARDLGDDLAWAAADDARRMLDLALAEWDDRPTDHLDDPAPRISEALPGEWAFRWAEWLGVDNQADQELIERAFHYG